MFDGIGQCSSSGLVAHFQCELQHWLDVMDRFDGILASVAKPVNGSTWIPTYDKLDHLEGPEIAVSSLLYSILAVTETRVLI